MAGSSYWTLLRALVDRRLSGLSEDAPQWGFWKSVASDPERMMEDFDELCGPAFSAEGFPEGPLRELFSELLSWVERLGYTVAPLQNRAAATLQAEPNGSIGRVLILTSGVESWLRILFDLRVCEAGRVGNGCHFRTGV